MKTTRDDQAASAGRWNTQIFAEGTCNYFIPLKIPEPLVSVYCCRGQCGSELQLLARASHATQSRTGQGRVCALCSEPARAQQSTSHVHAVVWARIVQRTWARFRWLKLVCSCLVGKYLEKYTENCYTWKKKPWLSFGSSCKDMALLAWFIN